MHLCIQEWGTGHRRTPTDSGGVTCAPGRRTVGQAAGPESEEWAPEWGQGDAGCTDGKGWGHKHVWPSRKRSRGESNAHPRNEGGGEGCAVQARRAARGCYTASPGPGLFTLSL